MQYASELLSMLVLSGGFDLFEINSTKYFPSTLITTKEKLFQIMFK